MKSFLVAALSATAILGFATATPAAAQATVTGAPKGTAPVGDEWRVFRTRRNDRLSGDLACYCARGPRPRLLILLAQSLDVRFAVRIEEVLAAFLPRRFEFGRRDIPVRPAFLGDGA